MPASLLTRQTAFYGSNSYFLDCNVLKYIYSPSGIALGDNAMELYGWALEQIKNCGANIVSCPILISEYLNMRIRDEFKIWQENYNGDGTRYDLKRFRRELYKSEYKPILNNVFRELEEILQDSTSVPDPISPGEINGVKDGLECDNLDVNDAYFSVLCHDKGYVLITHDSDFKRTDLEILTANQRLI